MKEIMDALLEAGQDDIKKGAGIGAGVGLALGAQKGEMLKHAAIGAGAGALVAFLLKEFNEPATSNKVHEEPQSQDQGEYQPKSENEAEVLPQDASSNAFVDPEPVTFSSFWPTDHKK